MQPVRYLLHFTHRYCTVEPGVSWVDAVRVVEPQLCPSCRQAVAPDKIEDLERIRGLRIGGALAPRMGGNTLVDVVPSAPTDPTN